MKLVLLTALLATACFTLGADVVQNADAVVPEQQDDALSSDASISSAAGQFIQTQSDDKEASSDNSSDEDTSSDNNSDEGESDNAQPTEPPADESTPTDPPTDEPTLQPTTPPPTGTCDCSCYTQLAYMCHPDGSSDDDDDHCHDSTCSKDVPYCYDGGMNSDGYGCASAGTQMNGWGDEAGPCCDGKSEKGFIQ